MSCVIQSVVQYCRKTNETYLYHSLLNLSVLVLCLYCMDSSSVCVCVFLLHRECRLVHGPGVGADPASRSSPEARGDGRDPEQCDPDLATQRTRGRSRRHLLYYWGLQVRQSSPFQLLLVLLPLNLLCSAFQLLLVFLQLNLLCSPLQLLLVLPWEQFPGSTHLGSEHLDTNIKIWTPSVMKDTLGERVS